MVSNAQKLLLAALLLALVLIVLLLTLGPSDGPGADLTGSADGEPDPASATLEGRVAESTAAPAAADVEVEPAPIPAVSPRQASGPRVTFWCRIVAEDGGEPIGDAAVTSFGKRAAFLGRNPTSERFVGTSDAHGLCKLQLSQGSSAVARVEAPGFSPAVFPVTAGHEDPERALPIRLLVSASLSVRILGPGSEPIEDAVVTFATPSYAVTRPEDQNVFVGELSWTGRTDRDGWCVLVDLPASAPLAATAKQGRQDLYKAPTPLVLSPGELRELTWHIGGGADLRGRLVDQHGAPVAGQLVWLTHETLYASVNMTRARVYFYPSDDEHVVGRSTTDALGRFSFEGVAPGIWWIGPAPRQDDAVLVLVPSKAVAAVATKVVVVAERRPDLLELLAHRGHFLRGRVVRPGGSAVHRAHVTAHCALGAVSASTEGGGFVLGPLEPMVHTLRASGGPELTDSNPVDALPGQDDVVLELGLGATLRGRFVDALTGEPCAGGLVVWCPDPSHLSIGTVRAPGSAATFEATGLAPGIYALTGVTQDGRIGVLRDVNVARGAVVEDLEVRLEIGAKLRLHYTGPSTYAQYRLLRDGVVFRGDGVRSTTSALQTVPAGKVVIRVEVTGRPTEEREVWCEVGKVVDAIFEFD